MTFESLLSDNLIYLLCYSPHSYLQEIKPQVKEDEKVVKTIGKEETVNVESEKPKIVAVEEAESHKPVVAAKERNIDLQLDLEKTDRDSGTASVSGNNKSHFHHNVQKLQQSQHTHNEKIGKFNFFSILFIYFWVGFLWRTTCLFFGCPIGFFLFCEFWYFFISQPKRALYLYQCLYLGGQVDFLPWGTIGLICYVFLALSVISSISVLLIKSSLGK